MSVTDISTGPSTSGLRRAAGGLVDGRLRPVVILLATGLALFTASRVGLSLARWSMIRPMGAAVIARCFFLGFRYDMMVLGWILALPAVVLSVAPQRVFPRRWFRRLVSGYATGAIALIIIGETIGAGFFLYRAGRLDYQIHYMSNTAITLHTISTRFPVWLIIPLVAGSVYAMYRLLKRYLWRGELGVESRWRRPVQAVVVVVMCVLACRGGWGRALDKSAAFTTGNNLVTQLSMNDFFTLVRAVRIELVEIWTDQPQRDDYPFPDDVVAAQTVHTMLYQPGEQTVDGAPNALWRRQVTGREAKDYNVVLIVMEGMSCKPVGILGFRPTYTPTFDALCREGIFFESMYAIGTRTNAGLMGLLCGHPDRLDRMPLIKMSRAQGAFETLPAQFRRRGYRTLFFHAGEGEFDNMKGFFTGSGGVDRFIDRADFDDAKLSPEILAFGQDLPDEALFDRVADELDAIEPGRKFFATVLTLSNHPPYGVPAGRVPPAAGDDLNARRLTAYRYADWAMGRFFDRVRTAPWFDDTIFVLVADHGHWLNELAPVDVPSFRVPCLFYAPSILKPRRVSTVCSQIDVGPTLLARLGGSYEHCFMGRDVLSVKKGRGFAVMQCRGQPAIVRNGTALVLPPLPWNTDYPVPILFRTDEYRMDPLSVDASNAATASDLQKQLLSFYATADQLYWTQTFRHADTAAPPPEGGH